MTAAIKAVEYGNSGINQAVMTHGVPKITLKDSLSSRVEYGSKPGPEPYLNDEEEAELYIFTEMFFYGPWKDKTRCTQHSSGI